MPENNDLELSDVQMDVLRGEIIHYALHLYPDVYRSSLNVFAVSKRDTKAGVAALIKYENSCGQGEYVMLAKAKDESVSKALRKLYEEIESRLAEVLDRMEPKPIMQ